MRRKTTHTPSLEEDLKAIVQHVEAQRAADRKLGTEPLRRRRCLAVLLLLSCIGLVALCINGGQQAAREHLVEFAALLDPVHLWRLQTRRWEPAHLQEAILSGEIVRTGAWGGARLDFPDHSMVKVGENSTFYVRYTGYSRETGGRHRDLVLNSGRLWARVSHFVSSDSYFTVTTPTALAGVRGTCFSVVVYKNSGIPTLPDGTTRVSVYEGEVRVTARGVLQRSLVRAGQEVVIYPRTFTPPRPVPMSAGESAAWQRQARDATGDILSKSPSPLGDWFVNMEEQVVVRPIALLAAPVHLKSLSGEDEEPPQAVAGERTDGVAMSKALIAGHALQLALETSYEAAEGYPRTIGLTDLSGLHLDRDKVPQILNNIGGEALLSYQRVGGRYKLFFSARPPSGELIEVTPEDVKVVEDVSLQ